MTIPPAPFALQPSYRATGERAARALAAGHGCVVLLGAPAQTDALLRHATAALAAGHAVLHAVPAGRFSPTDLLRPGEDGILVVADAERLDRSALRSLDAHLRREPRNAPRARLLLAATHALRDLTAFPDVATLHRAALLLDPPLLAAGEQAALLAAVAPGLDTARRAAWVRLAAGDATLLLNLACRGPLAGALVRAASSPRVERLFARPVPLALLSCLVLAAALAIPATLERLPAAPATPPRSAAVPVTPQSPYVAPAPAPPTTTPSNDAPSVERDDPGTTPLDDGVMVDHENPDQAAAEAAAHAPRMIAPRPGETLAAMYARVYRGIAAPPTRAAVDAVNPFPPQPGVRLVFPAPRGGWPHA